MATLTTLTLDADGTIGANVVYDAGGGTAPPFYTHCNDDPDSSSADYLRNDNSNTSTTAWLSLTDVDADFDSMDTLQIRVDGEVPFAIGGAGTLTARIYDADNDTTNPLTAEVTILAQGVDGVRAVKNVAFASLTGTKAQWNSAHIRFTWGGGLSGGQELRLFGMDFDGTYTAAAGGGGQKKIPSMTDSLGDGTGFAFTL